MDNENIQLTELTPTCFGKVITKPPAAELSQFLTAEDKNGNCMGGGVLDKLYRFPLPTQGASAARLALGRLSSFPATPKGQIISASCGNSVCHDIESTRYPTERSTRQDEEW